MSDKDYPGNEFLPTEVKERVLSTFKQTLGLYYEGKLDEVIIGCDLISDMDDRFDPAVKLREKALDPTANIDVASLLPGYTPTASQPAAAKSDGGELLQAVEAFNKRDFQGCIDLCNSVLARDPDNEEAQKLGAKAFEKTEAAPFVTQFLAQAKKALDSGNRSDALAALQKAKDLDPVHPSVKELDAAMAAAAAAPVESATPATDPDDGGGFNFGGGDDSPFASAFGGVSDTQEQPPASAPFAPSPPPPSDEGFVVEATVDTSPADETPATDFGFQFEDQPSDPSPPAAPPPAAETPAVVGEAQTFDFSAAAVEVSGEDKQKVDEYLASGDAAFARGEWQDAIDSWSKIFLIDVTNEEASSKIDNAKKKLQEATERTGPLLEKALAEFQNKDYQSARQHFEEVLALEPGNLTAAEHLEQLSDLDAAMEAAAMAGSASVTAPTGAPAADILDDDFLEESFGAPSAADSDPFDESMATAPRPAPGPPPPPKATAVPAKAARKLPMTAIIAVAVVVLAVGGWFGYQTFFGSTEPQVSPAATQATFARAEALAGNGNYNEAIKALLTIGNEDPERSRALQLINDYKRRQQESAQTIDGRPATEVFNEYLEAGRMAYESRNYVDAKQAFEQAAKIQKLPADALPMYNQATAQVGQLNQASLFFQQGDYVAAIANLETILQEEPGNQDALRMISDAHYNQGAKALKDGRLADAAAEFEIVIQMDPSDEIAIRSRDLALRYEDASQDLLFRIYTKYLTLR